MGEAIPLAPNSVSASLEATAQNRGDEPAIITPSTSISFEELFDRVRCLSSRIIEQEHDGPWLPVFVDRSIESAIALLAALRSGKPFVPIETSLPRAGLTQVLTMIGSPNTAVVAQNAFIDSLPRDLRMIGPSSRDSVATPPSPGDPNAPGLLLFTSGSTGRPKGVVLRASAVDRWLDKERDPGRTERVSVFRPLSFSGGFGQLTQVARGTTLCMADPRSMTLQEIHSFLNRSEVTRAQLGPALLEATLRLDHNGPLLPLVQQISIQGRRTDWSDIEHLRRLCHQAVTVTGGYASTETASVAHFRIDGAMQIQSGPVPNGSLPIDRLKLVECDEGREIWVRDPDALEYLDDPELTMWRFVTDDEGVRWWRSGDLGRIDGQGRFFFEGRIDHMVKINGVRVEPGESEAVLRSIPGIASAAVIAHPTARGSHRLVGHVCLDDDSLSPESLHALLSEHLPTHLVPAFFVRHQELPYTDRLKLDRQRLLDEPLERWTEKPTPLAPSRSVRWLTSKIEEIIGLGAVHPDEDFWLAGLDSMGAVELCSALAAIGIRDINPVILLSHRTILALDAHLAADRTRSRSPAVQLNTTGTNSPLFCIPGGGGTSFAFGSLALELGSDQPLIVIEPRGMHCRGRVERSIAKRVQTIVDEVEHRLPPGEQCVLMGYSAGGTIAVETARALSTRGRRVHLVLLDASPKDKTTLGGVPLDWRTTPRTNSPSGSYVQALRRWIISRPRRFGRLIVDRWLLWFRPGALRHQQNRYKVFSRILRIATERHTHQYLDVPTTLMHVHGSTCPQRCAPLVNLVDTLEVGGDHHTMLLPPHVGRIAEKVVAIRDSPRALNT